MPTVLVRNKHAGDFLQTDGTWGLLTTAMKFENDTTANAVMRIRGYTHDRYELYEEVVPQPNPWGVRHAIAVEAPAARIEELLTPPSVSYAIRSRKTGKTFLRLNRQLGGFDWCVFREEQPTTFSFAEATRTLERMDMGETAEIVPLSAVPLAEPAESALITESDKEPTQAERLKELLTRRFGNNWNRPVSITVAGRPLSWLVWLVEKGIDKVRDEYRNDIKANTMRPGEAAASLGSFAFDLEALVDEVERVLFPKPKPSTK